MTIARTNLEHLKGKKDKIETVFFLFTESVLILSLKKRKKFDIIEIVIMQYFTLGKNCTVKNKINI